MSKKKIVKKIRNPIAVAMNKRYPIGRSFAIETGEERGGQKNEQHEYLQEIEDDECEDEF